jgi:uncharacterized protein YqjF (DUF2071 family)
MALFLKADWENIIMVNYEIDPDILRDYLPKGVEIDLFENKCYISLVGFMFKNTKIFNVPIPKLGTFEEINLRFYVKRKEGDKMKRGVVFINETIPYKPVAWVANKLYHEHYSVVPTKHHEIKNTNANSIKFEWLNDQKWNSLEVTHSDALNQMKPNSLEEFIYEHYFGYTKVNDIKTEEYKLHHPSWLTYPVLNYKIECDFQKMYGEDFKILNSTDPTAVFIAKGSKVGINWKRNKLSI